MRSWSRNAHSVRAAADVVQFQVRERRHIDADVIAFLKGDWSETKTDERPSVLRAFSRLLDVKLKIPILSPCNRGVPEQRAAAPTVENPYLNISPSEPL
jgi:hypothetical protein